MTGYGRGESSQAGYKVTVEMSSVNRKQTEIAVTLPRDLEALEAKLRDSINKSVARGRVTVRVSIHIGESALKKHVKVNLELARLFAREFQKLGSELNLQSPVTLELLIRTPGVLETGTEITDAETFWPPVEKALQQALGALIVMRVREGAHLRKDLQLRIKVVRRSVQKIKKLAPLVVEHFREQLKIRLRDAGVNLQPADDERLTKEIVYFADRADISEELTRLESHFGQFDEFIKSGEPVGRMLDFLSQEMNREINTIGSKANHGDISREVVVLKTELERFREQVQNVE